MTVPSWRTRFLLITTLLLSILSLAACSPAATPTLPPTVAAETEAPAEETAADPTAAPEATEPAAEETTEDTETTEGAYPIAFEHKYGTTEITEKPERVVLVGLVEQDILLQLGTVPVATTEWYGEHPGAIFPWAVELVGDAPLPEVLNFEIDFEKVAALQPDVIIGLYSGITEDDYNLLSQIAPTVAQPLGYVDYGVPWQEATNIVGQIMGQTAETDAIIADIEAKYEATKAAHPEFEGKEALLLSTWGDGTFYAYGPEDPRVRFLTELGFSFPTDVAELTTEGGEFGVSVSDERLDITDVDVAIWFVETQEEADALLADPIIASLDVAKENRIVFLLPTDPVYDAYNFTTPLSLEFVLDNFVPTLAEALGESSTETTPTEETTAAFPVTIDHKYGSTEITAKPERVVLVGLLEQDILLALGTVPVATTEWFGGHPGAIFPWATDELGDAPVPEVLTSETDFEKVAALQPDVIIALYSGITEDDYNLLSQIAPTVAQPLGYVDYGVDWQEASRIVGQIMGQSAETESLIADVEAQYDAVREAHPEFEGKDILLLSTWGEGTFYAYGPEDVRVRFLMSLGFTFPEAVSELTTEGGEFGVSVSDERMDLTDVDVAIWFVENESDIEALKADPILASLDVFKENRVIFLAPELPVYEAFNFNTVLSIPFVLEEFVPSLVAAADGDPATIAE
jgi:iron complex transport system substrate-binding protein